MGWGRGRGQASGGQSSGGWYNSWSDDWNRPRGKGKGRWSDGAAGPYGGAGWKGGGRGSGSWDQNAQMTGGPTAAGTEPRAAGPAELVFISFSPTPEVAAPDAVPGEAAGRQGSSCEAVRGEPCKNLDL